MNIKTFKKLSLKAGTKKADSIHDYYITMETTVQKHLVDTFEQKKQIENETKSNMLIEQNINKKLNYIGVVKKTPDYMIAKYGKTDFINETLIRHRKTYGDQFYFAHVIECESNNQLENLIQNHDELKKRHIKEYGIKRLELLKLDKTFN
jgi:hypothetical protein